MLLTKGFSRLPRLGDASYGPNGELVFNKFRLGGDWFERGIASLMKASGKYGETSVYMANCDSRCDGKLNQALAVALPTVLGEVRYGR